jgi:ADP-heptose:LPS heptosyltransferase
LEDLRNWRLNYQILMGINLYIPRGNLIGDVLVTHHNMQAIKKHFSNSELWVLCDLKSFPLFEYDPHVDKIITDRGELDTSVFFQHIFNFCYFKRTFSFVKRLKSINKYGYETLGVSIKMCEKVYSAYIPLSMYTDEFHDLPLSCSFGNLIRLSIPGYQASEPVFYISEDNIERAKVYLETNMILKPFVCFFPGSGWAKYKRWPLKNFLELALKLCEKYSCIFILGPNELKMKYYINALMHKKNIHVITGLSLQELGGIYKNALANITNDSGPMHISASVSCPTIAIFGNTNQKQWFTYNRVSNLVIHKNCNGYRACFECRINNDCIKDISVNDVYEQTVSFLNKLT